MRPASGTWGSMPPVLIAALLLGVGIGPAASEGSGAAWHTLQWVLYHANLALILIIFSLACIVDGEAAEARFGKKDPSQVVADETAGQCLPLMFLPASALADWKTMAFTLVFAFVCFRALDIVKPWPARQLQRVPGGWGILIDDLFAGVYALLIVQGVTRWGPIAG